jgi:hypothetical protein
VSVSKVFLRAQRQFEGCEIDLVNLFYGLLSNLLSYECEVSDSLMKI